MNRAIVASNSINQTINNKINNSRQAAD